MARKSAPPATFPGSFHVLAGRHNPYCNRPRHGRDGTRARPAEALPVDRDGARPRDARALERCWSFVQRVAPTVRRHDRATWYPESPHEPDPSPHPSLPRPRPSGRRPPPVTGPSAARGERRRKQGTPQAPRAPLAARARARPPRLGIGGRARRSCRRAARAALPEVATHTGAHDTGACAPRARPPLRRPSARPRAAKEPTARAPPRAAAAFTRRCSRSRRRPTATALDGSQRTAVLALGAVEVALDVLQQEPEVRVRDRVLGRDGDRRAYADSAVCRAARAGG